MKRQYCLNCHEIHVYQNHIQMYKVKISNYGKIKIIKKWWSEKYACLKNNTVKKWILKNLNFVKKKKKTLFIWVDDQIQNNSFKIGDICQ